MAGTKEFVCQVEPISIFTFSIRQSDDLHRVIQHYKSTSLGREGALLRASKRPAHALLAVSHCGDGFQGDFA
jgi:hypothetical protein